MNICTKCGGNRKGGVTAVSQPLPWCGGGRATASTLPWHHGVILKIPHFSLALTHCLVAGSLQRVARAQGITITCSVYIRAGIVATCSLPFIFFGSLPGLHEAASCTPVVFSKYGLVLTMSSRKMYESTSMPSFCITAGSKSQERGAAMMLCLPQKQQRRGRAQAALSATLSSKKNTKKLHIYFDLSVHRSKSHQIFRESPT